MEIFLITSKLIFFPEKIQNCYVNRLNFQAVFFGIGYISAFLIFKKSVIKKYSMEAKYLSNATKKIVHDHSNLI